MSQQNALLYGDNTSDINLVSALAAMGVDAETAAVNTPRGIQRIYMLDTKTKDGRYTTKELITAWKGDIDWIKGNVEHPFAYVMNALRIRKELVDGIKKDKPMEKVTRGDSVALLKPDCSEETEKEIMGRMS